MSISDKIRKWIIDGTFARLLVDLIAIFAGMTLLINAPSSAGYNDVEKWMFAAVMVILTISVLLPAIMRVLYLGYPTHRSD